MSPAEFQWALQYSLSPIFLVGGIASSFGGGAAPILSYLPQGSGFPGLSFPGPNVGIDDYFAQFIPLPGSDLVANDFGTYPFANQQTAANAIITMPLSISMMMICPARGAGGYFLKAQVITALQATLQQHNLSGGTYIVVTPALTWDSCLLARFRDMTGYESKQVQWRWQFDFIQPLITGAQAQAAQGRLMASLTNGQTMSPNGQGNIVPPIGGANSVNTLAPSSSTLPPNSIGNPTPNAAPFGGAV